MKAKKIRFKFDGIEYEATDFDLREAIFRVRVHRLNQRRVANLYGITEAQMSEVINSKKKANWLVIAILLLPFIEAKDFSDFKNKAYSLRYFASTAIHDGEIILKNFPKFKIYLQKKNFSNQNQTTVDKEACNEAQQ